MKEIEEDTHTHQWRNILCSWIGRINIAKMSTLPKVIYKVNAIVIKILIIFFTEIEKTIQKHVEKQKAQIVKKAFQ
jgi:hypothetical protein